MASRTLARVSAETMSGLERTRETVIGATPTRFAISHPAMGTILVGMATPQQFEDALAAVEKGPLPQAALERLSALQREFCGEAR